MPSVHSAFVGFAVAVALTNTPEALSQNCEPRWDLEFASPGANGQVLDSLVFDDGTGPALYMAGWFDEIGGERAWALARWDGRQWREVGGGLSLDGARGDGMALAVWDDGAGPALYVGGRFDRAGAVPANNVARWDGHEWSALGDGTVGIAWELCEFDYGNGSSLYVGGSFIKAGGIEVNHIARWDGRSWGALGAGLDGESTRYVSAMAVFDDGGGPDLYVGGSFLSPAVYLVRWNGREWSALEGVHLSWRGGGYSPMLEELIVFDDGTGPALFMSGAFEQRGVGASFLKWDGQEVTQPPGLILYNLGPYPETMTVEETDTGSVLWLGGGSFTIAESLESTTLARWDGNTWTYPGSYASYWIYTLSAFNDGFGDALYVGGDLRRLEPGNIPISHLMRWATPHMALDHSPLRAGERARISTTCTTPGRRVYFVYSATGLGSFYVPQLNVTLDLDRPQLVGSSIASEQGTAQIVRTLPPNSSGRTLYMQAAEPGRKSKVVEATIE